MNAERKAAKTRIALVDDHAVLRNGMKHLIAAEADMDVVGEAEDGKDILALIAATTPDVLVMDLSMPEVGGLDSIKRIRAQNSSCKILVLTVHEDRGYLQEVMEAGALGYMLKRAAPDDLIRAIRSVAAGNLYVDSRLATKLITSLVDKKNELSSDVDKLTAREQQVLRSIAEGYSLKEIASTLSVSVKTVETYKARSMEKLGLSSRVDIVRAARQLGWFGQLGSGQR